MSISRKFHGSSAERCAGTEILLTEYCAGELDLAEAALVESHLQQCSACRAERDRELYLREILATLPVVSCPTRVTDAILAKIDQEPSIGEGGRSGAPLSRRWPSFVGWAAAAAALVLLLSSPRDPGRSASEIQTVQPQYSAAEVQAARQDLKRGLLLAARIIDHTERSTVKEVFGHTLPESLTRSIKTLMTTPEGGQG